MTRFVHTLLTSAALLMPLCGLAQTIAPPTSGLMMSYQFWPQQFVQWLGPEVPYSMLELDVITEGKTPLYDVTLTSKDGEKRVHYTNDAGIAGSLRAQDFEVHITQIAFEPADTANTGSISTLRLTLADGKALQWHFVQGSDISEQGSGLTPLPEVPVPVFAYREQGALAGEGTAVQIGDAVSVAEVWKEISRPPYFVAYRGAYTVNAHRLMFSGGQETWKIAAAPKNLAVGAVWEMDGGEGSHRTLRVEKVEGTLYTLIGFDPTRPAERFTMDATRSGDAWVVQRVRFVSGKDGEKHPLTVQFPAGGTSMELMVGKKTVLASASLSMTGEPADRTVVMEMRSPAWCKGKTMTEETIVNAEALSVAARPKR